MNHHNWEIVPSDFYLKEYLMLEMDLIVRGLGDKWTFMILKGMSVSFQDYRRLFILINYYLFSFESFETCLLATCLHPSNFFFFLILKSELLCQNANLIRSPLPPWSHIHTSPSYLFLLLSQTSGQHLIREAFHDP